MLRLSLVKSSISVSRDFQANLLKVPMEQSMYVMLSLVSQSMCAVARVIRKYGITANGMQRYLGKELTDYRCVKKSRMLPLSSRGL